MKNLINFIKKFKVHILSSLLLIVFIGSCKKNVKITKLNNLVSEKSDSLKVFSDSLYIIKKQGFNQGKIYGKNQEKELILNFIDDKFRAPQNLKVRSSILSLYNEIDSNKYIKK